MAASGDTPMRYDSSGAELSSPPSMLSEPGSPSRNPSTGHRRSAGDEIVVGKDSKGRVAGDESGVIRIRQPQTMDFPTELRRYPNGEEKRYGYVEGEWVQLTMAGQPRKKPGRKPGTVMKQKPNTGASDPQGKVRKPKKPRDPSDAATAPKKRKIAPATNPDGEPRKVSNDQPGTGRASASQHAQHQSGRMTPPPGQHQRQHSGEQHLYSPSYMRREGYSMQSILNSEPSSQSQAAASSSMPPARSGGQSYDPVRGNYDPVRETMVSRDPYPSTSNSPRPPSQVTNRSPSIASLLEPPKASAASPGQSNQTYQSSQPRFKDADSGSMPPSPSQPPRAASVTAQTSGLKTQQVKNESSSSNSKIVIKDSNFTTIASGPVKQKPQTGVSTPKTDLLDEMSQEGEGRSILDFGKARPGDETQVPTIVLNIPIQAGENNKYVNFMRMAEDRYGWDALHPRQAANRDRKARIAAAAASLEKVDSGRESGDEMSVDLSDGEGSNQENGATSGPDAQAKPKKKRNFKEDQYDVDDDFVDDSELLWEAKAAASRDGFFVYSGPLVPEEEKPPARDPPKRGRGRGSRGGRVSTRGTGTSGRGGGPGSRGGSVTRKPRITKSEKLQREREKAEREKLAQLDRTPTSNYVLQPTTPALAVSELGA